MDWTNTVGCAQSLCANRVVLLAIFFFLYLASLSWADISFVMPLTAMSFIFAALLAKFVLKEDVSWFAGSGLSHRGRDYHC